VARGSEKLAVLAVALGVSDQALGRILAGVDQVSLQLAIVIELVLHIPASAWGLAPNE